MIKIWNGEDTHYIGRTEEEQEWAVETSVGYLVKEKPGRLKPLTWRNKEETKPESNILFFIEGSEKAYLV
jgi:hypothetical protein